MSSRHNWYLGAFRSLNSNRLQQEFRPLSILLDLGFNPQSSTSLAMEMKTVSLLAELLCSTFIVKAALKNKPMSTITDLNQLNR